MKNCLIVFFGSGLGGVCRHLLNYYLTEMTGPGFPWGILIINVTGSAVLGAMASWFAFRGDVPMETQLFLTTGIVAGYTTFSTFSLDTVLIYERGQPGLAVSYVVLSIVLSIAAMFGALTAVRMAAA